MRAGFTLAEVLVVLVLLGILSVVVAPSVAGGARPHPSMALAGEVRGLLAGARREAIRRGVPVALELDTRSGRFRVAPVSEDALPGPPVAEGVLPIPGGVAFDAPTGVRRFVFDPLGAGRGAVVVRGGGRVAAVEIDPWTGEARALAR